jgi:hypothetical protein
VYVACVAPEIGNGFPVTLRLLYHWYDTLPKTGDVVPGDAVRVSSTRPEPEIDGARSCEYVGMVAMATTWLAMMQQLYPAVSWVDANT